MDFGLAHFNGGRRITWHRMASRGIQSLFQGKSHTLGVNNREKCSCSWHLLFFALTRAPFPDVHYSTLCSSYFRSHFIMSSLPTSYSLLHGRPTVRRSTLSTASPARAAPRPIPLSPISPSPPSPPSPPSSPISSYLPFNFGAEFELIIRPKEISFLSPDLRLPSFDASHRQMRDFNRALLHVVSKLLSDSDLACKVFEPDEDEGAKPDYSQWHITLDASLSKKHIADGFCE
jgi:hypothetical protein